MLIIWSLGHCGESCHTNLVEILPGWILPDLTCYFFFLSPMSVYVYGMDVVEFQTYIRTVADILTQCFSLGTDDSVYGAAGSSHRDNFTQPVSVASYSHGKLECILEFGQICQDTGKLDQCSSRYTDILTQRETHTHTH